MEQKNLICIGCPLGCNIEVALDKEEIISITGNTCKRGAQYARKEVISPTRIVTSTVKVLGGKSSVVSVKTKADIPKNKVFSVVKLLKEVKVPAPVTIGDVILKNVAGTEVDVVATKNVQRSE